MAQRLLFIVLFCLLNTLVFCANSASNGDGAVKFEVGGKKDDSNIKNLFTTINSKTPDDSESGDGSGDDDKEIYSGSGSGEPDDEIVVTVSKTTPKPTAKPTKTDVKTDKSKPTVVVINEVSTKPTKKTTSTLGNEVEVSFSPGDKRNTVGASTGEQDDEEKTGAKTGVDFTVGIIVGVVVGAILAILVIVFLVYRLRKKDEGSYSLDEQSSQAFIKDEKNGGQGKEYFA